MPVTYNKPNKYDYVTRKAFDRYCDLIDRRRQQEIEAHRADLQFLTNQNKRMQLQLDEIQEHVASHCHVLNDEDQLPTNGNEGLE